MKSLKISKKLGPGLTRLVDGQMEYLKFSVLRISSGQRHKEELAPDIECVVVLLSGECEVEAGLVGAASLGPRQDVFDHPPWAVYFPGGACFVVEATRESELALSYAPWKGGAKKPVIVTPPEVVVHRRGNPGFRRQVRDIVVDRVAAGSLLVGETINRAGEWSSYPPHKHDAREEGEESQLEEVYFYKVHPRQGFGFQRVYTADRSLDEAVTVENDDLVMLPRGYHPVAAAPGYRVYYLWALAGPEREMKPRDDPDHAWVINES